jgi:MFS family permease
MSDPTQPNTAYEAPDPERPASASPTEQVLEDEAFGRAQHDPYAAFRHHDYTIFVAGFFISVIAAQIQTRVAQYDIYERTSSKMHLGWIGLALAIPMLLLTLPAGHLADVRSRRRIMLITQVGSAICAAGLALSSAAWISASHPLGLVYALLALGAVTATIGRPARAAIMPQLVPAKDFPNAVAWNSSIFETASVLGPAIGGFMLAASVPLAYAFSAICFLGCAIAIWFLPEPAPSAKKSGKGPGLSDLAVGIKFVWRTPLMLAAMTLDLFAVLLGGAVFLMPAVAKDILHVGPIGLAFLWAAPSVGAISTAMIQAHRPPLQRAGMALIFSVAGYGLATIVFGLSRNFWLSFVMLALTGACDNISVVVRHTLVQLLTPDSMRGRVSAVNQIFIGSSNELGGLESGITAAMFGTVASIVGGGIGTLIVVAVSWVIFKELRYLGSLADLKPQTESA